MLKIVSMQENPSIKQLLFNFSLVFLCPCQLFFWEADEETCSLFEILDVHGNRDSYRGVMTSCASLDGYQRFGGSCCIFKFQVTSHKAKTLGSFECFMVTPRDNMMS
jgi:hypothetical protein